MGYAGASGGAGDGLERSLRHASGVGVCGYGGVIGVVFDGLQDGITGCVGGVSGIAGDLFVKGLGGGFVAEGFGGFSGTEEAVESVWAELEGCFVGDEGFAGLVEGHVKVAEHFAGGDVDFALAELVLLVGGHAHGGDGGGGVVFGEGLPGDDLVALDLCGVGVRVVGGGFEFGEDGVVAGEGCGGELGVVEVAGGDALAPVDSEGGVSGGAGIGRERGEGVPVVHLHGEDDTDAVVAVGAGELHVVGVGEGGHTVADGAELVGEVAGFGVFAGLEPGVDEELVGVHLVGGTGPVGGFVLLGGGEGGEVGGDVGLPHAEAGEDVAGHVEGVGRGGSDFGVDLGGLQTFGSEGGGVAGVDDVVGEAWVVGILVEEREQDGEGGVFFGEGGVVGCDAGDEGEGVEGGTFDVVGEGGVESGHVRGVGVGGLLVVVGGEGVEVAHGLDVGELAWGGFVGASGGVAGFGHLGGTELDGGGIRLSPELLEVGHGEAPVGHGTGWVGGGDRLKLLLGESVAEGVQQRDAASEGGLRGGCAGDGEVDLAELLGGDGHGFVVVAGHAGHGLGGSGD